MNFVSYSLFGMLLNMKNITSWNWWSTT